MKISILCGLLMAFVLSGCFTGIENTGRITEKDVSRVRADKKSPEEIFFDTVHPADFQHWRPGKLFYVNDDNIRLIFNPSGQGKLHTSFLVGPPVEALVSPDTFATAKESAHERNAAGVLRRPLMAWLETLAFPLERNAAQAWHVGGSERGDLPPLKGAGRPCCRRWCSACGGEC